MAGLISIILATFNREDFILDALKSIQNQTYTNFECIIIDDGSTDNTSRVIIPILEDSRFKYYNRNVLYNKGLSGCRNYGLDLAKGNYISFCDDDDIMHPQNLEICINHLKSSSYSFVHFKKKSFTSTLPEIKLLKRIKTEDTLDSNDIFEIISHKTGLASCTVMWKYNSIGKERFDENLMFAEELELYTRIISKGHSGLIIDEYLYFNKKHSNSNTGEFWSGNRVRQESLILSYKSIFYNLSVKGIVTYKIAKFFIWQSFILNNKSLYNYIIKSKTQNFVGQLRLKLVYHLAPAVQYFLIFKKKLKIE